MQPRALDALLTMKSFFFSLSQYLYSLGIHEFKKSLPELGGGKKSRSYDPIGPVASHIADRVHLLCFERNFRFGSCCIVTFESSCLIG